MSSINNDARLSEFTDNNQKPFRWEINIGKRPSSGYEIKHIYNGVVNTETVRNDLKNFSEISNLIFLRLHHII